MSKKQVYVKGEQFRLSSVAELGMSSYADVSGFAFDGWSGPSGTYSDGQAVTFGSDATRLSARWRAIDYSLTYLPEGVDHDNPPSYRVSSDAILLSAARRQNYDFVGWYGPDGNAVTSVPHRSLGDRTLSAAFRMRKVDDVGTVMKYSAADGAQVEFGFAPGFDCVAVMYETSDVPYIPDLVMTSVSGTKCGFASSYVPLPLVYTNQSSQIRQPFSLCSELSSVKLLRQVDDRARFVNAIGEEAFYRCSSLSSANFPVAKPIGNFAFGGCGSIRHAECQAAESIDEDAFYGCSSLSTVILSGVSTVTRIDTTSFGTYRGWPVSVYVKPGMKAAYDANAVWASINVETGDGTVQVLEA